MYLVKKLVSYTTVCLITVFLTLEKIFFSNTCTYISYTVNFKKYITRYWSK